MNKKQLRAQYEAQKPPMGIFLLKDTVDGQDYLGISTNLPATKNSLDFRLSVGALGNYPVLQQHYLEQGKDVLHFSILEKLDYQKDGDDYIQELQTLLSLMKHTYIDAKEIVL